MDPLVAKILFHLGNAIILLLYFIRIQKEEYMVKEQLGGQYEESLGGTGRLFPKL